MHVWVDADSCPRVAKEILFRAAVRVQVRLTLVANRPLRTPHSPYIDTIEVGDGFDVADQEIIDRVQSGDLVITADIPLAASVVRKGAFALDPRGTLYTNENVGELLATRDLLDGLRASGTIVGGPPQFDRSDRLAFANHLDRFLARKR
jgi:uncharacterized protein